MLIKYLKYFVWKKSVIFYLYLIWNLINLTNLDTQNLIEILLSYHDDKQLKISRKWCMAGEIEWCCIMCEDEESRIWMMLAAGDDLWYHPNFSRSKIWHKIMLHSFTEVRHGIILISSRVSSQNKHKLQQKLLCPSCVCLQINYVFLSPLAFKAL